MGLESMIHKYKMNGLNIVLDVNSGSVHAFDDVSFDIIEDAYDKSLVYAQNMIIKLKKSKSLLKK